VTTGVVPGIEKYPLVQFLALKNTGTVATASAPGIEEYRDQ